MKGCELGSKRRDVLVVKPFLLCQAGGEQPYGLTGGGGLGVGGRCGRRWTMLGPETFDPSPELRVAIEEIDGHAGGAGHVAEVDRLAALGHGFDGQVGLGGSPGAFGLSGLSQRVGAGLGVDGDAVLRCRSRSRVTGCSPLAPAPAPRMAVHPRRLGRRGSR